MHVQLRAAFAGILFLCAPVARAEDTPKFLSIESGTTYALSPIGQALAARVTIRAEPKIKLADLDVSIVDVIADGRHDPSLFACIKISKDFKNAGTPAITLTVTCEHRRPDDYDVTIAVTKSAKTTDHVTESEAHTGISTQSEATDAAPQKLAVKLTRPVPVLRAIASQSVRQTVIWPKATPNSAPSSLIVSETSNRTLPITFSAQQVDAATIDGEVVNGRLEFTSATTDANGHAELPIRISQSFPLGKAKTTIELRSSDLVLPVYVTYDVTTKLHGGYVFAAILIGLMLGFLTRTVLKTVTERGAARIAGLDLVDKMQTARDRWAEATFRTAVNLLISALDQALAKADAAALKEAVTKTDSAFVIASTELQQRIATLLGSIETAAALTRSPTQFPRGITDALATAAESLAAARMQVVQGNVDTGRAALQTATTTMGQRVERAAADWRTALQGALATIGSLPPFPPPLQAALKATLSALADQISRLPSPSLTPNVATILDAVHAVQFIAQHDLAQRLLVPLATMAEHTAVVLRGTGATAITIESTRATLLTAVQADIDTTLEAPANATSDLLQALQKELRAAAVAAQIDVAPELGAGTYVDAAIKVANASSLAARVQPLQHKSADTVTAATSIVPPLTLRAGLVPTLTLATREPVQLARARTFREIATAKVVQFVIASVGIAIVGLLTLLPTFDGTWRGVVAALFWGYAGDISIDALTDAAKRVK